MTIRCPTCGALVESEGAAWARCKDCRAMIFPPSAGPEVVLGEESETLAARVGVAIAESGCQPVHVREGRAALEMIEARRPAAAVLDVALADPTAFHIIEHLRARRELGATKVVLVASVFNRTAYKRRPTSLYGADDYVEQHHVHDLLPKKLCALLGLPEPRTHGIHRVGHQDTREDLAGSERVRALARSIVGDIALYHPDEIARAVRGELAPPLAQALAEGRRLLHEMAPAAAGRGDPVAAAFDALLSQLAGDPA